MQKFDKQEKRLDSLMTMVLIRRNKDKQYQHEHAQNNASINENTTREDQEWEMIKEKYEYDELEPERQQIIEQQFQEMIHKRRRREIGIDDILFDDDSKETETIENIDHIGKK